MAENRQYVIIKKTYINTHTAVYWHQVSEIYYFLKLTEKSLVL